MRYFFITILVLYSSNGFGQSLNGYVIHDFLVNAVHPYGCDDNYVIGMPDDSTWVNFNSGDVMTGNFGMSWSDDTGDELLLETSYHSDNYNVRLLLSTGFYSSVVAVNQSDWTQITDTTWVHLFTDCTPGVFGTTRYILALDFLDFGLGPGDVVTGIEITFLATGGAPDLAGVYIISEECNTFSLNLGPDRFICGNTITLNASTPNATYQWQDNSTGPTYLVTEPGTYWVNVTVDDCTKVDTVHVFDGLFPVNLGNDTTLCPGATVILDATTPGGSYEWQDNAGTPLYEVSTQGTYMVTVTVGGCEVSDTINVNYFLIPDLDLGNDTSLCEDETLILDATTPGATYLWQDNSTDPTFLATIPASYSVTISVNGCTLSDNIAVNYIVVPPPDLGSDITLCHDETLLLSANTSGASYQWQDNSGNPTFLVTEPGTYWVIVEVNNCSAGDTVEIDYVPEIVVDLGDDITLCDGVTVTLNASIPGATYQWQDNSNSSTYTVNEAGEYWVIVELQNCFAGDTIIIDYGSGQQVDLGDDLALCEGETVLLDATTPGATYLWHNNSSSPFFVVTAPGEYWVEVNVDDCISMDTVVVEYLILESINLGSDTVLCEGENIMLNAFTPGATYLWQDNSTGPQFVVTGPGNFWVTIDLDNCSVSDTIIISYNSIPQVNLGNDTVLCIGQNLLLESIIAGATNQWQDNSSSSTFVVTGPGTYWVVASIGECNAIDSIVVSYASLAVDLGKDTTICEGQTLLLQPGATGQSYQWQDNSTNSSFLVTQPGNYFVNVGLEGCSYTDSIFVDYLMLASVYLGEDTVLCQGETLTLDVTTAGGAYQWQDNSTSSSFAVLEPGEYWVIVSLMNCSVSDTIDVDFISISPVDLGADTTLCSGQALLLNVATPNASYIWQDNSSSSGFLAVSPGTYSVTVSVDNCSKIDSINIAYLDIASIHLGNDTTLCAGETLTLTVNSPGADYLWQDNTTGGSYVVSQSGIYYVLVNIGECSASDTISVNYNPAFSLDLGRDTTLCEERTLLLDAETDNATYLWQDNSTAPFYTVTAAGLYWVSVEINGCSIIDSILIDYVSISATGLGKDTTLCEGTTLMLDAGLPGYEYLWQDNSVDQTLLVAQQGIYWVMVNTGACSFADTIMVDYVSFPIVDLGNDSVICRGQTVALNVETPGASYQWQDNSTHPFFMLSQPGTYWVHVNLNGCIARDTVSYDFIEIAVELGNDTTLCAGESLLLDAGDPGVVYSWHDGASGPTHIADNEGKYWVQAELNACLASDTIYIHYDSIPAFTLGEDLIICKGETVILDPAIESAVDYLWQDHSNDEKLEIGDSGVYWLQIRNDCGISSDTIIMAVEDCACRLYVPNVFSPNGDGMNDELIPFSECELSKFEFMVFDRAGNQFFSTNNNAKGWDGTFRGQAAQVGVYAYVIIYSVVGQKDKVMHGDITLLR